MKYLLTFILYILFILASFAQTNPNHVWVSGYYRSNGTFVSGHYRTAPNHTNADNFSTQGNTNPYTGKKGWVASDGQNNPWANDEKEATTYEVQPYTFTRTVPNNISDSYRLKPETGNYNSSTYTSTSNNNYSSSTIWFSKGNQVNVRFEPNTSSRIAYRINKQDNIQILKKSDSEGYVSGYGYDYWYQIKFNNLTGWVFGKLIGNRNYNTTSPENWDGEILKINGYNVNVRNEPSIDLGEVIFQLNQSDEVEVIAKTTSEYFVEGYGYDFWYYVEFNNQQGWVFGKLTDFK